MTRSLANPDNGLPYGSLTAGALEAPLARRALRWALYGFVFSILFEGQSFGLPVELTTVMGGLLVLAALTQPGLFLRMPSAPMWCFLAYLYIAVIALLVEAPGEIVSVLPRLLVLVQMMIFFWIASRLMREERVARNAMVSLVAGSAAVGVMNLLGLTTTNYVSRHASQRLSANGLDPNQLAGILALSLLVVVGLALAGRRAAIAQRFLAWASFAVILIALVKTESRGGILSFAAGMAVFALSGHTPAARARNLAVVLLGAAAFLWIFAHTPHMRDRFAKTVESGDMTGREQIYPRAWGMFLEKPVLGWGPLVNTSELGDRVRRPGYRRITAHNLVLYLLTATGILGAFPFLLGTWMCARAAWGARGGPHGFLPFALVAAILIADMSVDGLHWKQHWLAMAYAVASLEFSRSWPLLRQGAAPAVLGAEETP